MTATVIQLPTDRPARRVPESSRRRHPAGGGTVVQLDAARRPSVVRHGGTAVWPRAGDDGSEWARNAHAVIESAESMLRDGRAAEARDLCARAAACFEASKLELDDPDAVALVLVRLRQLHRRAARAAVARPG